MQIDKYDRNHTKIKVFVIFFSNFEVMFLDRLCFFNVQLFYLRQQAWILLDVAFIATKMSSCGRYKVMFATFFF